MTYQVVEKRKANMISLGVFLIAIGIVIFTQTFWPGILIALWALLGTRQLLTRRFSDFFITTFVIAGILSVFYLHIDWSVAMPIIFVTAGIYIILKEYFYKDPKKIIEIEEDYEP